MSVNKTSFLSVVALEIHDDGTVTRKSMPIDRESQLDNTLLQADYPGIRVATLDIPQEQLDEWQQAMVERSLGKRVVYDGIEYCLVGASASAKNGKYYAVDAAHANQIAKRFRFWPEAALTYFGILVSPCKVCLEFPEARVLVVRDHELGTNDCRGWIRRSLFERLHLRDRHFYQFRMSFDGTQAKGSFKIMEDDAADALSTDIVIPRSSCKPEYKKSEETRSCPQIAGGRIKGQFAKGRTAIGIREISRNLDFSSSYTLVEHAPLESIETEIKPEALSLVDKVKDALQKREFEEFFKLIGISDEIELQRTDDSAPEDDHTSTEHTVVEAILRADPTGYWIRHPFVNGHLQRMLAKWAFKLCTAGGFKLPAFALADDGYLALADGKVVCGSDWIPESSAIVALESERMLIVRYPIRTKSDLLPVRRLEHEEVLDTLLRHLNKQGCLLDMTSAREIVRRQISLAGTCTLHSKTAKLNGGDYDFDWICVVDSKRFPLFVADRWNYTPPGENTKNKQSKKESPWWNLPQVAYSAKGNAIGQITDLKTSCLAVGRTDLADQLAVELQKALDQLKWGVAPDQEVISRIRQEVGTAPWLKLKRVKRVSELPMQINTCATDRIGALYNFIRKELDDFFSDVRPVEDFRGAIYGGTYDRDMQTEAAMISRMYGMNIGLLSQQRQKYQAAVERAQAAIEAFPVAEARASKEGAKRRRELFKARTQAQAALHFFEERSAKEIRNLINIVRKWADRKQDRALDWLTALWDLATKSRRPDPTRHASSGSIAFYAFPQLIVDQIVERTGGRPITVSDSQLVDGEVRIDQNGNVYLCEELPDGTGSTINRETLILQVPGDGRFLREDGRSEQVPAFSVEPGMSQIREGKLTFPNTRQRPGVPKPKTNN